MATRLIETVRDPGDDEPGSVREIMTATVPPPILDELQSALDAGCAALVALEALPDSVTVTPDAASGAQGQIKHMIKVLRKTISEVRATRDEEASVLAFGFVLAAGADTGVLHARPRRTA
jgi:hypothetical protein